MNNFPRAGGVPPRKNAMGVPPKEPQKSSEQNLTRIAKVELLRRKAQREMLPFLRWVWWMPTSRPLRIGRHTKALCERLTKAVDDWLAGKSTYLIINMPFRHGKSDLVSRALPSFFLGRCSEFEPDVILSGYGTSLVKGFSRKVQSIMRARPFQQLFPEVLPDERACASEEWRVKGSQGTVVAQGLGGAITGKGGHLIIVDDYCKNREEAESKLMRDKIWDSFSDDLMTRTNAPASIVIVCATRWHEDDVVGRILESMAKDPSYPQFEQMVFPARKEGEWDILFPELYDAEWYNRQRAQLGTYSASALLDCVPIGDEARTFKRGWLRFYDSCPKMESMSIYILADSANSKKQASDYTTLWVIGLCRDGNYYILDGVHDRMNLTERTDALFDLHRFWKARTVVWEQVGAMADVAHIQYVQEQEDYRFHIMPLSQSVDKATRIRALQPLFESGRVWLPRQLVRVATDGRSYDLVKDFIEEEYLPFPSVKHDDMLDPMANLLHKDLIGVLTFPKIEDESEEEYGGEAYMFARTR